MQDSCSTLEKKNYLIRKGNLTIMAYLSLFVKSGSLSHCIKPSSVHMHDPYKKCEVLYSVRWWITQDEAMPFSQLKSTCFWTV